MKPSSRDDWTLFLENSTPTSFGLTFPDSYTGSILEFWKEQVRGDLRHVVDIGCGNGALCWIADELLNHPSVEAQITGIDFADIDPFRVLGRAQSDYPGIEFMGNTFAENLPFADESVDLVMSQYGIEYSDLDRSIPEAVRVLRPGGRLAFILHDTDSEVVRLSTEYLADMRKVWSLGIHDLVLEFYETGQALRTLEQRRNSTELARLANRLNALTAEVRELVRAHSRKSQIHRYMNRLMDVFAGPLGPSNTDAREVIVRAGEQLRSHIRKIEHLEAVALTKEASAQLARLVERNGCRVTRREALVHAPQVTIGTVLVAARDTA
jgi:ubiquinone/menaquinone biosynthesis C-methylase UbiE